MPESPARCPSASSRSWLLLLVLLLAGKAVGQVESPTDEPAGAQDVDVGLDTTPVVDDGGAAAGLSDEALDTLLEALQRLRAERDAAQAELLAATTPEQRKEADERLDALEREVATSLQRFTALASGADLSEFGEISEDFDLVREVQGLLEPVVFQLKAASELPRRIQQLERAVEEADQRRHKALRVVEGLEARLETASDPELRDELGGLHRRWQQLADDQGTARQVALAEKLALEAQRVPFLDASRTWVDEAFRKRGRSILLAIGVAIAVVLVFRAVRATLGRVARLSERRRRSFYSRVIDVLWSGLTVVAALLAVLAVFYMANDWLMLVLVLIFLVGVGWASVQILPNLIEQIQVVLNLGGVREGERVLWNDVPYRVHRLGFYTTLTNPDLSGGLLRVPVRELVGFHSRPVARDEPWFPTHEGDWVILGDDTRAQVEMQTPEAVRLALPGGSPKTYPTPDFCALAPRVLSAGFRVEVIFGVDYAHQAICTTEIPRRMLERLRAGLSSIVPAEQIERVECEFMAAAASSLDYEIQADFDGAAAASYERLQFGIQRILVETCNDEGWVIPFQQLTVHRAD